MSTASVIATPQSVSPSTARRVGGGGGGGGGGAGGAGRYGGRMGREWREREREREKDDDEKEEEEEENKGGGGEQGRRRRTREGNALRHRDRMSSLWFLGPRSGSSASCPPEPHGIFVGPRSTLLGDDYSRAIAACGGKLTFFDGGRMHM